jgi:hypothetical protein
VAGVISFLAVPPASRHRLPVGASDAESSTASCNTQLQLATFLRSVDYRGLMSSLTPFEINSSKNLRAFCISLISGHLKSPIINTSANFDFKLPRINTSKKMGGGPVATLVATGGGRISAGRQASPSRVRLPQRARRDPFRPLVSQSCRSQREPGRAPPLTGFSGTGTPACAPSHFFSAPNRP